MTEPLIGESIAQLSIYSFLHSSVSKSSACNAGDLGSIPGLGSSPGAGNGNLLPYSCLENPTDIGNWQAIVHGIAKVRQDLAVSFFLFTI